MNNNPTTDPLAGLNHIPNFPEFQRKVMELISTGMDPDEAEKLALPKPMTEEAHVETMLAVMQYQEAELKRFAKEDRQRKKLAKQEQKKQEMIAFIKANPLSCNSREPEFKPATSLDYQI